ncbi:pre-rRNA-processing protein pno1 [Ascosphaera pollenicola]|nr:pre-rRNA-processing protein pno1 [Ascosphaera pollenicola]
MTSLLGHPDPQAELIGYSFADQASSGPQQRHGFYPYTDNGGTTLGITGPDFALLAGDTRSTHGYSINTRFEPKVFRIGADDESGEQGHLILAVVGYAADGHALKERLDAAVKMYKYRHGKPMGITAAAKRLSTMLYSKRFFPYYVSTMIAGLDEEGKGALYSYDPVGSYEREFCRSAGAASSLVTPFLDNQVNAKNQYEPLQPGQSRLEQQEKKPTPLTREVALQLVHDAFDSAAERHIEVGDGLQTFVITRNGIEEIYMPLKKD